MLSHYCKKCGHHRSDPRHTDKCSKSNQAEHANDPKEFEKRVVLPDIHYYTASGKRRF